MATASLDLLEEATFHAIACNRAALGRRLAAVYLERLPESMTEEEEIARVLDFICQATIIFLRGDN